MKIYERARERRRKNSREKEIKQEEVEARAADLGQQVELIDKDSIFRVGVPT